MPCRSTIRLSSHSLQTICGTTQELKGIENALAGALEVVLEKLQERVTRDRVKEVATYEEALKAAKAL